MHFTFAIKRLLLRETSPWSYYNTPENIRSFEALYTCGSIEVLPDSLYLVIISSLLIKLIYLFAYLFIIALKIVMSLQINVPYI